MKFFDMTDFSDLWITSGGMSIYPTPMGVAEKANAKLEREGKIVWAYDISKGHLWWTDPQDDGIKNYKALLIGIEKIEVCKHPAEKVSWINFQGSHHGYGCECGAKVKPSSFEVCE